MKIFDRYNHSHVLFEYDAPTMRETVIEAHVAHASLRNADLRNADLRNASLRNANLSGANLSGANLSGAYLSGASLSGADLSGADLSGADLSGADLSGADLSGADLSGANLSGADLSGANLRNANLRNATLPTVVRVKNLNRKILRAIEGGGELDMGAWHTCETTHCRAGWAIHLAGAAGKVLEDIYGPEVAGTLIYAATYPNKKHPDFFASTDEALADIKKCAGVKNRRLTGYEAIEHAAAHGGTLGKFTDPTEGARVGLTISEAHAIAASDPGLVYLDTAGVK